MSDEISKEVDIVAVESSETPKKRAGRPRKDASVEVPSETKTTDFGTVNLTEVGEPEPSPAPVVKETKTRLSGGDLGVYTRGGASVPEYKTDEAAGMDVAALFDTEGQALQAYSVSNQEYEIPVRVNSAGVLYIIIPPSSRVKVPTGLFLDIPKGYKVEAFPRSGTAFKTGLALANSTAVIDSDYTDELFIIIENNSNVRVELENGTRVAQITLESALRANVKILDAKPEKKGNRTGGIGSTGVK